MRPCQSFQLRHTLDHQGHVYEVRGLDSTNKDHYAYVLEPETDWFTWSTAMIVEYHARYADDWQGRMKTIREDRAFIHNVTSRIV